MADEKKVQKTDYVKHQLSQKKKKEEKAVEEQKVEETKTEKSKPVSKDDVKEEKPKKASKKEEKEEKKFVKESVHTIPLKKAFDHPKSRRVKYAIREVKRYIVKHTRKEAFVDPKVNELLWENSIQNPPRKIKVKIQEEENRATAVLE